MKSRGRFGFQLILEDNTWSTLYNIPKKVRYSFSSTDWTLVSLNFNMETNGIKLRCDQVDTPHSQMCFSKTSITHSVF